DALGALAELPDAVVGAGTVLEAAQVKAVAEAGGRFVISPVFDPEVVDAAHGHGLLAVPGAATPTEILAAWRHGAHLVKVFPAAALGGPAFLRALRGPLPEVPLVPTSGPTSRDLAEWFAAGANLVGIGAEVCAPGRGPAEVEAAARRVRAALDAARAGAPTAPVRVDTMRVGPGAQALACAWEGGQLVAIVARRGLVACGILDPAVCERFDFAVALAHGTPEAPLARPEDLLAARIDTVSSRARAFGVTVGMTGAEALARLE
ncbi:MAG: DUF1805 domain-containing protein, partial [Myxococcota bacterium]|nr:DUF1805 domain-containing protein [Myxococcota bacterium]